MRPYAFHNTIMLINGMEITGWDTGDDVIQITRRNDSASDKVGAGGEMMVSLSSDRSGEITFKLLQVSPSNKFLQGLLSLQEASAYTMVPLLVMFQDTFRSDMAIGTGGYIKKPADLGRGIQGSTHEWTVVVERLEFIYGGF